MRNLLLPLAASALLFSLASQAKTSPEGEALVSIIPGAAIQSVTPGPIRGWSTVVYNDGHIAYVLDRGRHVVLGNVVRVRDGHSYTVESLGDLRRGVVESLPADLRITYSAPNQRAEIHVFTDVSCSFCVMFHRQNVPLFNQQGVTVHYYPAPRGGRASIAWPVMRDIWCSPDPKAAFSAYIKDHSAHPAPAPPGCDFDTSRVESVAASLGMRGTPGVYSVEGIDLGGAAPVPKAMEALGLPMLPAPPLP